MAGAAAVVAVLAAPATAGAKVRCPAETFRVGQFKRYAGAVYERVVIRRPARVRMTRMRVCTGPWRRARMVRWQARFGRERADRKRAEARTATASPIPWSVVMCESGGRWDAVNPSSGAYGRYQILPMHVRPGGICAGLSWSRRDQTTCARRILARQGLGAWECA